jgi:hypothetical protein
VLDIGDNGPVIDAGGFRMRVTNAGIVGNAFLDSGRSFDPSFEFPPHSGVELLNYAALWVGGIDERGRTRVSGGLLLEFRPTLAADDVVRTARRGDPGTRWRHDDDGDGRLDEEILDGRDDDGDALIDEDLGFTFDRLMTAEYVDDRPEAVNFAYETGETHVPLGLSVHQEVGAWSRVGFKADAAAGGRGARRRAQVSPAAEGPEGPSQRTFATRRTAPPKSDSSRTKNTPAGVARPAVSKPFHSRA